MSVLDTLSKTLSVLATFANTLSARARLAGYRL
jgi:hypothetical protein